MKQEQRRQCHVQLGVMVWIALKGRGNSKSKVQKQKGVWHIWGVLRLEQSKCRVRGQNQGKIMQGLDDTVLFYSVCEGKPLKSLGM